MNNSSFRKRLTQSFTLCQVFLYDLYLHSKLRQLLREIESNSSSSADQYLFDFIFTISNFFKENFHLSMRCRYVKPVSWLQDKFPIRNINLCSPLYCTDQNFNLILFIKFCKGYSSNRAFLLKRKFYQFHSSFCKRFHLTCNREDQYSGNLICNCQFRVYCHT